MNDQLMRKSYAVRFVSYLIDKLAEEGFLNNVDNIILFGSVAKEESTKQSDVDIFVELREPKKKFVSRSKEILQSFYNSKDSVIFKTKGIDNRIDLIIGKLKDWKDIHRSIMSTGIVLYGSYIEEKRPGETEHKIIFYWDSIGKNRGAFINSLYGFNSKGKYYKGILDKIGGERIGKSCVIIPIKYREDVIELFKKYKVNAKSLEVFVG